MPTKLEIHQIKLNRMFEKRANHGHKVPIKIVVDKETKKQRKMQNDVDSIGINRCKVKKASRRWKKDGLSMYKEP